MANCVFILLGVTSVSLAEYTRHVKEATTRCTQNQPQKRKSLALHMTSSFMRRRGIEPRPIAWKAIMLTTTPTPLCSGNQDASQLMTPSSKFGFVYGGAGNIHRPCISHCNMRAVHRGQSKRNRAEHKDAAILESPCTCQDACTTRQDLGFQTLRCFRHKPRAPELAVLSGPACSSSS